MSNVKDGGCINSKKEIQENNETENRKCTLSEEQQIIFNQKFKIGIYKQLHKKGLLTDMQLRAVINL